MFFLTIRNNRKKGHLIKDKSKNFKIRNKILFTIDKMEIIRCIYCFFRFFCIKLIKLFLIKSEIIISLHDNFTFF